SGGQLEIEVLDDAETTDVELGEHARILAGTGDISAETVHIGRDQVIVRLGSRPGYGPPCRPGSPGSPGRPRTPGRVHRPRPRGSRPGSPPGRTTGRTPCGPRSA